ncbi:MAG: hypothetical protein MUO89_01945, partial [Dehalococcoidia bacterium]|nr:hypothetical protein [Dehalococcoidia bacterium]
QVNLPQEIEFKFDFFSSLMSGIVISISQNGQNRILFYHNSKLRKANTIGAIFCLLLEGKTQRRHYKILYRVDG